MRRSLITRTVSRVVFRSLGGLKMFGEKNLGKGTMYVGTEVLPRLIFTNFNAKLLILLVKIILIRNCKSVTNSGGLMLVSKWASVNDLVQNKFHSKIHILSQHLLAQIHRKKHKMNVQDLLKVNNKDTRTKSLTSFWCPYC